MVHDTKVNYMIQNAKPSLKITLPPQSFYAIAFAVGM